MNTVRLAITQLRAAKGITQQELADALQVSVHDVRQWEDGVSWPEVPLLPHLAAFFHVSIEEMLGGAPPSPVPSPPEAPPHHVDWGQRQQYLQQTRLALWNDDYVEFLVAHVWKLTTPVRILDYGCGDGFLGKILLPLLPAGSTYTGVDRSPELLEKAAQWFATRPYQGHFIQSDLVEFEPDTAYDLACCQAVLRHLQEPKTMLRKMARSVVHNGLVACIEVNRAFETVGLWIEGCEYHPWHELQAMSSLWETELAQGGRDHAIALKLPGYMKDIGLQQIDMRLNDKVWVLNPTDPVETYTQTLHALKAAHGWDSPDPIDEQAAIAGFERRGMTNVQARQVVASQKMLREYVEHHAGDISIVKTFCLLIAFGYKR
jgi:SAM-dependent methyltransferase/DNA-binding XRE family transcriptional regulator